MKSGPANPVLNPDENSLSSPSSNKSNEMLSDKVVDQRNDTEDSCKSASSQSVPYENGHGENQLPVPSKRIKYKINTYAIQCGKCRKWRLVPTKMTYEEVREKSRQVLFSCEHVHGWKPGVSCDDPADISQDDGFWVIDKPCLSQAPPGWERTISIRSGSSSNFTDVYYTPPKGRKLRSTEDVNKYLQDNPDYAAGMQASRDWFARPTRLKGRAKKHPHQLKPLEPNEVLPLSCAPPVHEDLAPICVLALRDGGQKCM